MWKNSNKSNSLLFIQERLNIVTRLMHETGFDGLNKHNIIYRNTRVCVQSSSTIENGMTNKLQKSIFCWPMLVYFHRVYPLSHILRLVHLQQSSLQNISVQKIYLFNESMKIIQDSYYHLSYNDLGSSVYTWLMIEKKLRDRWTNC